METTDYVISMVDFGLTSRPPLTVVVDRAELGPVKLRRVDGFIAARVFLFLN
jgi:hypothetical protein